MIRRVKIKRKKKREEKVQQKFIFISKKVQLKIEKLEQTFKFEKKS